MKKIFKIVTWLTLSLLLPSCSQDTDPLVIGFWNAENLFDTDDDPNTNDDEFAIGGRKNVTSEIYELKNKKFSGSIGGPGRGCGGPLRGRTQVGAGGFG